MFSRFLRTVPGSGWTLLMACGISLCVWICLTSLDAAAQTNQTQGQSELQDSMNRMVALQQQLFALQQEVIKANEDLKNQQEELVAAYRETFNRNVSEAGIDVHRLKELNRQLREKELSPDERKALQKKIHPLAMEYEAIRKKTYQDEDLLHMRHLFQENLQKILKKEHPEAEDLAQEIQQLQAQFEVEQSPESE